MGSAPLLRFLPTPSPSPQSAAGAAGGGRALPGVQRRCGSGNTRGSARGSSGEGEGGVEGALTPSVLGAALREKPQGERGVRVCCPFLPPKWCCTGSRAPPTPQHPSVCCGETEAQSSAGRTVELQPANPLPPHTPREALPSRAGGSHPFPFKPRGLQGRRGAGSRPHVPIRTPGGGNGEEGHGPGPCTSGAPNAVSPGGGQGPRSRIPVPPALLRSAGRCQPQRGGTAGPGGGEAKRHQSGSPGPPRVCGHRVSTGEDAAHRARGAGLILPWRLRG